MPHAAAAPGPSAARPARVVDVAVIGAGSVGIAVAYHLCVRHGLRDVILVDPLDPMSLTSAQSGENYRNWWPHPVMTAFTDHSISLMERLDAESGGRLSMTRGGYALVSRTDDPSALIEALHRGYGSAGDRIRIHDPARASGRDGIAAGGAAYVAPVRTPWTAAPDGVDVLLDRALIRQTFPRFADDVRVVVHVRRAGSISAQQMGQYMLETLRAHGVGVTRATVTGLSAGAAFTLGLRLPDGSERSLSAARIVNAAGPFLGDVAALLGESLPVRCVYQQKIAFEDRDGVIARDMPFTIDLDGQTLAWSDEDRDVLAADAATRRFVEPMPGGIHCRPDGAVDGRWIKLGWAFNQAASDPHAAPPVDPHFPDTVLRGASRLHPGLARYLGRLPRGTRHYGGYYTMTDENWPLIGPMRTEGAFVAGALSGYGTMAACAAGELCAAAIAGAALPAFAAQLGLGRQHDAALLRELRAAGTGAL